VRRKRKEKEEEVDCSALFFHDHYAIFYLRTQLLLSKERNRVKLEEEERRIKNRPYSVFIANCAFYLTPPSPSPLYLSVTTTQCGSTLLL
jgi:hypothetical protein